jgi:hypothetical protein
MKKFFCVGFVICFIILSAFCASAETAQPAMEQGSISAVDGAPKDDANKLRTADFIGLYDFSGIGAKEGYQLAFFVYDADNNYLGSDGWLAGGLGFTTQYLAEAYPMTVYFKFALRKTDNSAISPLEIMSAVTYYSAGQEMPESVTNASAEITFSEVMEIGSWQEGAIFDNKLFAFNFGGRAAVFDLSTKEKIADITVDDGLLMALNPSSVCFSSQYYDEKDKYPLIYANIAGFGNFSGGWGVMPRGMEGTCFAFRILETDDGFKMQLVQAIKIGFTDDTELWGSSYGYRRGSSSANFVIDTDNNQLYVYVTCADLNVTRFFKFDLPKLDAGEQNVYYDCKEVTLNKEDIKEQFDLQPFYAMQGCDYIGGKVISAEGMGGTTYVPTVIRVVDLKTKEVVRSFNPTVLGVLGEPSIIATDTENGDVYYATTGGELRKVEFAESIFSGKGGKNQKNGGKTALIVVIIAVAVVALGVLSAVMFRVSKKKAEQSIINE